MSLRQRPSDKFPDANNNQLTALYIAMVVRNAMEDFHVKHLSDSEMAELNPIIRNAIYTALYAMERQSDPRARENMKHQNGWLHSDREEEELRANWGQDKAWLPCMDSTKREQL